MWKTSLGTESMPSKWRFENKCTALNNNLNILKTIGQLSLICVESDQVFKKKNPTRLELSINQQ